MVQSKYGTALSGPNTITLEAQKLFATLEGRRESLSSLSRELVERLKTFISNKGDADKLEYVVATSRKLTEEESEYLNNVRVLGRNKFGDCFDTDSVSIETLYNKVCEEQQVAGPQIYVNLTTSVSASTDDLLIGATTLPAVFAFMGEYKSKTGDLDMLYEKNVRKFLGSKRKVNKGIENTIEHTPGQTRFLFMMALVDLVKYGLIQSGKPSQKIEIVKAVQALGRADLLKHFGDVAVGVIDDYLVSGGEDTIYLEPEYKKRTILTHF